MAVKYLGSSCQREVCEAGCPGQHQFYRACILPPRALPEPQPGSSSGAGSSAADLAASLAQAHAASSGRPILLILDLHRRLRSHSLEGLLQINTPEQLQVGEACYFKPAVFSPTFGSGLVSRQAGLLRRLARCAALQASSTTQHRKQPPAAAWMVSLKSDFQSKLLE